MKLNNFAYLYSNPLGNHTLKIMKKYLEIYWKKPGKIMEISWNFVSPKMWEPWDILPAYEYVFINHQLILLVLHYAKIMSFCSKYIQCIPLIYKIYAEL